VSKIVLKPLPKENPEKNKDEKSTMALLPKIEPVENLQLTAAEFLLQSAAQEGYNLYGIADAARDDEVFRFLITGNVQYMSLFEGTMDVQSYSVSGFLVECKKESSLFQWMTAEAWGNNCCIFFTSKASFEDLFKHFQQFNRVYIEGDDVVLFRYYDPRVLRTYLPTCTQSEIDLFFGQVESFFAENKEPEMLSVFKKNRTSDKYALTIKNVKIISGKNSTEY